jgi:hypothetical protein
MGSRLLQSADFRSAVADSASRARSPASRERGPAGRARSPASRERSPTSRARGPASRARSPASRARSPASRERSPASRARSPASRARSPASRARSPASRARSPSDWAEDQIRTEMQARTWISLLKQSCHPDFMRGRVRDRARYRPHYDSPMLCTTLLAERKSRRLLPPRNARHPERKPEFAKAAVDSSGA